jgi:Single Cache domain 2
MFWYLNWGAMKFSIGDLIKFRNLPIFWKISFIPIIAVGHMMIGVLFYVLPLMKEKFIDDKRTHAAEIVNVADSLAEEYDQRAAKGEFTLQEAQHRFKERIRKFRFGKDGIGYIWINDLEPTMLMIFRLLSQYLEDLCFQGKGQIFAWGQDTVSNAIDDRVD